MRTMEEERATRVKDVSKGMRIMVDPKLGRDRNQAAVGRGQ